MGELRERCHGDTWRIASSAAAIRGFARQIWSSLGTRIVPDARPNCQRGKVMISVSHADGVSRPLELAQPGEKKDGATGLSRWESDAAPTLLIGQIRGRLFAIGFGGGAHVALIRMGF